MVAKVREINGAWWVVTHHEGRRRKKRIGASKADKHRAEEIARKINAQLALGEYRPGSGDQDPLPCDAQLRCLARCPPADVEVVVPRSTKALVAESGANIRWVSEQLGHSDPGFTLRV